MGTKRTKTTNIGDTIREAINAEGWSVAEVSRRAGIPYATCWRFLNREGATELQAAEKLCDVLGMKLVRTTKGSK